MPDVIDTLHLANGFRLAVVAADDGPAAIPMVADEAGGWRRAQAGDGAAEALLGLLATTPDATRLGRFTVRSWTHRPAAGERAVGVDQTNESVIVGDAAVVKWATRLQEGPHPALSRVERLRDFAGVPAPWGMVTWRPDGGAETVVVTVAEYLPGAVDGWIWVVEEITTAALTGEHDALVAAIADVGALVADLHTALAPTTRPATATDLAQWRAGAEDTLASACAVDSASADLARERRREITDLLAQPSTHPGTPVIEGHGDLHVGQILRSGQRFVVTDFDGNPVLPADQRALPIPAALDVAGMTQSLAHAAIVAAKYTVFDDDALAAADAAARAAFLTSYARRLTDRGVGHLYVPALLRPLRIQQVLREIIYAATHLPRWMYVPDAALPALLDERTAA